VTAAERDEVDRADTLSEELLRRLRAGRENGAFRPGEIAALEKAFTEYYAGARSATLRMVNRQSGETLRSELEDMALRYASLHDGLEASIARQQAEMQAALDQARENHRRSMRTMTLALVLGLVAVGFVSRIVIRSTIDFLRRAATASAALSGRGAAGNTEVADHAGDEIAQILSSMQRMMAALVHSEGRLKEAQRLARVGSWEWDVASARTTWSEEMHRLFGIDQPPPDVHGFLATVHPGDREQVKVTLMAGVAARWPFHHQFRIVRPDGEVRTILTHNEVVLDERGVVAGLRGAVQDVTDIEQTASALRESEERYRMLFENNPHPMWVYDVGTLRFLAVNAASVAHYGYSREEFLGMTIADIRPEEDRAAVKARVAAAAAGLDKAGVWRHRRKDGSVVDVEISSHSVLFGAQPARLVLASDVTEKRRLEHQLRQAQ
jgi:PAS domain S-box-containing protein